MSDHKNSKKYFFLQCIVFFLWSATCLSSIGNCSSLEAISFESLKPSYSPQKGRPLPLVGHWNCGDRPGGFGPGFQLWLLQNKHHILPWVRLPEPGKSSFQDVAVSKKLIEFAAEHRLPISFVSSQWEKLLTTQQKYFLSPEEENPNTILLDGRVAKAVSPFGPSEPWREVGESWTNQTVMKIIQKWYPDPPLVLFISNNEHAKLHWYEVEKSRRWRYVNKYGLKATDDYKRKLVGDGWIQKYQALFRGMREGLVSLSWKKNILFIGYDAFPDGSLWRWKGWEKHSLHASASDPNTKGSNVEREKIRLEPWSSVWDGASASFYTHDWDPSVDFTTWSPQVRAMNLVPLLEDVYLENPVYWFELSVWDGSQPKKPSQDKRSYYTSKGQKYTPERYAGMVQFGMWLLRPRVVREFRGRGETIRDASNFAYFMQILKAVDNIYRNQILERFWRYGTLVPNGKRQHLHRSGVLKKYKNRDRWFLLDTQLDPQEWELGEPVPVFSLALVLGEAPSREWLVYTFAPLKKRDTVAVGIPGYKKVDLAVEAEGRFYHIQEQSGAVEFLNLDTQEQSDTVEDRKSVV